MSAISWNQNTIRYKKIEHERVEDAPFVGALISACDCHFNCQNCFNQELKRLPPIVSSRSKIISEVLSNPFNRGVIFAGLEWTLQLDECLTLASEAKNYGLQTMLYTGCDFDSEPVQTIVTGAPNSFDYIKCGTYQQEKATINHIEYGVILASSNQHIYKRGVDY